MAGLPPRPSFTLTRVRTADLAVGDNDFRYFDNGYVPSPVPATPMEPGGSGEAGVAMGYGGGSAAARPAAPADGSHLHAVLSREESVSMLLGLSRMPSPNPPLTEGGTFDFLPAPPQGRCAGVCSSFGPPTRLPARCPAAWLGLAWLGGTAAAARIPCVYLHMSQPIPLCACARAGRPSPRWCYAASAPGFYGVARRK
jgi:hypothetical protein